MKLLKNHKNNVWEFQRMFKMKIMIHPRNPFQFHKGYLSY